MVSRVVPSGRTARMVSDALPMSGFGRVKGIGVRVEEGGHVSPRSGVEPGMEEEQFATATEARDAILGLCATDLAKLMVIARFFVRPQALQSVMDADDLLHEAIVKTLDGTRRWNKRVSIVKHLDRVMESDAGHARRRAGRTKSLEEHEAEIADEAALSQQLAKEQLADVLPLVANDEQALEVLRLRGDGYSASEIRAGLGLSETEYDTVGRRIRRLRERLLRGGEQAWQGRRRTT